MMNDDRKTEELPRILGSKVVKKPNPNPEWRGLLTALTGHDAWD